MRMPRSPVSVVAILLLVLGLVIVVFSSLATFEPESAQWLSIASGVANIALGAALLYLSTVKGKGV